MRSRFAEPIYFGDVRLPDHDSDLNNRTATIVDLAPQQIVLKTRDMLARDSPRYSARLASSADTTFQIGNHQAHDALARIQSEDIGIDLAVIALDGCRLAASAAGSRRNGYVHVR